ncbi:TPA: DUF1097 domain-containing protein [Clostridium perfringens]|uniref:DUF1097 domain-containing protein n=1 Tax=Clostridium perfringens TaxID=1502 RepID=UPI001009C156|nr:DUF1097 domain-containing protein [Clostridium perfringens]EJT5938841.1 DUF1097 domain-containing protein [Clostridium perfringens]EJT6471617.1 DUF1097 domain-containing protein [Clostridium perfringens]RXI78514.1 DUF1097 domain-containing protein [Clostridium perfringens]RXI82371.1 DUF1097 domain-containing protein [Clostridium perfringens]RXI83341.1 DUF1097 domain-containing protein [Clostridium perfringens]
MDVLVYVAISVGVLSGVWAWMAAVFGMVSWTGFVGWTSYYSSGGMAKGLFRSLCSNATGIIYALLIIKGSSIFQNEYWSYFLTAFFSFMMVIQAKLKKFEFISGAFCGCFSTFGLNGNWQAVVPALLCGNVLGYISQKIGIYCHKVFNKN